VEHLPCAQLCANSRAVKMDGHGLCSYDACSIVGKVDIKTKVVTSTITVEEQKRVRTEGHWSISGEKQREAAIVHLGCYNKIS